MRYLRPGDVQQTKVIKVVSVQPQLGPEGGRGGEEGGLLLAARHGGQ